VEVARRLSVEEGPSTVKASATEEAWYWALERPMRESRVVLRRPDIFIFADIDVIRDQKLMMLRYSGEIDVVRVQKLRMLKYRGFGVPELFGV
jgi:hypothetical protein